MSVVKAFVFSCRLVADMNEMSATKELCHEAESRGSDANISVIVVILNK